jgi:hypothetical protein
MNERIRAMEDKVCDLQMNLKMSGDCTKEWQAAHDAILAERDELSAEITGLKLIAISAQHATADGIRQGRLEMKVAVKKICHGESELWTGSGDDSHGARAACSAILGAIDDLPTEPPTNKPQ